MPPQTSLIIDIETRADKPLMAQLGYDYNPKVFAPHIFHIPCAIAAGAIDGEGNLISVESLGDGLLADDPCELTQAFWKLVGHTGVLIGFNSWSFDLPVMELCAFRYGCATPTYWAGQGMRYRYGKTHVDIMDILSKHGVATKGLSLSNLVQLLGYRGKDGMDGSMVQGMFDAGRLEEIREYNRRDVISTYIVWLQFALISGRFTASQHRAALNKAAPYLDQIRLETAADD